jgi:hypothetical protein
MLARLPTPNSNIAGETQNFLPRENLFVTIKNRVANEDRTALI